MEIKQVSTPNYSKGRSGKSIVAIVNHITAGSYPGCLSWLCNAQAQASAHYLITRQGLIYQLVNDEDSAWHCGIVNQPDWLLYDGTNPNRYTIGIEHEGQPGEPLTEEQYQATLWLHRQLIAKWGIPIDSDHIIGHYRIDSVNRPNCPGSAFPWDRLINDLREGVVSTMIEDWQKQMGIDASNVLASKGLLSNPESWADKMGDNVPVWLFFEMLRRVDEKKG